MAHRILVTGFLPGTNGVTTSVLNLYRKIDHSLMEWDFLLFDKDLQRNIDEPTHYHRDEIESLGGRWYSLDYSFGKMPQKSRKQYVQLLNDHPEIRGVYMMALGMIDVSPVYYSHKLGLPLNAIHCHTGLKLDANVNGYRPYNANRGLIKGDDFIRLACSDNGGRSHFGDHLSYIVFPNACDLEKYSYKPIMRQFTRRALGFTGNETLIGMVGTIYKLKNPLFALRAFEAYLKIDPNAYLVYVGSGSEKGWSDYLEASGLRDRVLIIGNQTSVDLLYNALDALLMPSGSEGLPNVGVEAQATGLPCLISDQVTPMVELTDLVRRLPVSSETRDPWRWGIELADLLRAHPERRSYAPELKAAGYDIQDCADRLTHMFVEKIERADYERNH